MSPYIINVTQNIGGNKSYFSHHTTTTFCLDYRLMQIKLVLKLVLCVSIILKIYVKGNVVIITTNPTFQKTRRFEFTITCKIVALLPFYLNSRHSISACNLIESSEHELCTTRSEDKQTKILPLK